MVHGAGHRREAVGSTEWFEVNPYSPSSFIRVTTSAPREACECGSAVVLDYSLRIASAYLMSPSSQSENPAQRHSRAV